MEDESSVSVIGTKDRGYRKRSKNLTRREASKQIR